MTKKIVLHVGSGKAGSTYLQSILIKNEPVLKKAGWRYDGAFRALNFESSECVSWIPAQSTNNLIVSNENCFNPIKANKGGCYQGASKFADWLRDLGVLSDFEQVSFIYIARNLLDFHVSQFNQRLKQGRSADVDRWLSSEISEFSFRYNNIIDGLTQLSELGAVRVMFFENLSENPRKFVNDFFGIVDPSVFNALKFDEKIVNPSISEVGAKVLGLIKPEVPSDAYMQFRKLVQAYMPKTEPYAWEARVREKYNDLVSINYRNFSRICSEKSWLQA